MKKAELKKWQTTASKYIVNDRWLKLRADTCVTPDGHTLDPWYVMEYPGWVGCLAVDENSDVIMLRHYRHGIDDFVLEIIGGNMDPGDTSPKVSTQRELAEEIGYEGGELYQTGTSFANPSNQNNRLYSFLAVGGNCTAKRMDEPGADFIVEKVPFAEFVKTITNPNNTETYQSLQLASIFFSLNFIRSTPNPTPEIVKLRRQL
ncbi:MAG TPA: NUDIX hydrolase [Candidatus Saccharimonadia bacterium]|nr:NUDIX hydrolase [Candidatus Saccharimonadia bacterium]